MHRMQEGVRRLRIQIIDDRVRRVLRPRPVRAVEVPRRRAQVHMAQKLHLPGVARLIRRRALGRRQVLQLLVRRHRDRDHLLDRPGLVRLRRPDRQRVRRHRHLQRLPGRHMHRNVRRNVLHPKLRIPLRDISPGKSARVVALVLDPHPHVALGQLAHDVLHQVHVARRKVRRLAVRHIAPPGRQVDHEDAVRLHLVQVEGDPPPHIGLVRAVPALELLHRPILARRRDEVRRNLRRRRHRNHLPRTRLCLRLRPRLRLRLRRRSQNREEQNWKKEERDEREPAGSLHCIDSGSLIFVRPGVYSAACAASHQAACRKSTAPQPASS